eukprot:TRINITY_DN10179_c0_g1_i1.p1 TRINITY_DN10179_c0_g1~~TRINITY_DN10179_c0_g1_i1.p1  ORF type:complete len:280 (-),score=56.59 TRINITY_DN10179_c0_g1_i1:425-1264(-)
MMIAMPPRGLLALLAALLDLTVVTDGKTVDVEVDHAGAQDRSPAAPRGGDHRSLLMRRAAVDEQAKGCTSEQAAACRKGANDLEECTRWGCPELHRVGLEVHTDAVASLAALEQLPAAPAPAATANSDLAMCGNNDGTSKSNGKCKCGLEAICGGAANANNLYCNGADFSGKGVCYDKAVCGDGIVREECKCGTAMGDYDNPYGKVQRCLVNQKCESAACQAAPVCSDTTRTKENGEDCICGDSTNPLENAVCLSGSKMFCLSNAHSGGECFDTKRGEV